MRKLISTILKTLIFFIGWAILISFTPEVKTDNPAFLRLWWELTPLASVVLFSFVFVFLLEKRRIRIPIAAVLFKNSLIGVVIGFIWLGSVIAILLLTKTMHIQGFNHIEYIWIWILASLFNTAMQELLMRGYLYQLWKHKYNTITATVITTVLFTAMHGGAFEAGIIPVLNVVSMSVLMTILLEYTGTIAAPIIVHFIWNTIGAIIFGGVSLANDYPNLLNSTYQGNELLSGGEYKIEGSIVVSIINLIIITYLFIKGKKKSHVLRG
ncbi:CPBP family intramembrane metalloprotease [Virgibacillus sp. 7505]|uniref:CPBP family intramembrane glutamic endopeptidase n=1 Tax=Virgibacillus sp. 7505 TaxID=2022548 RepID=UPI000BA70A3E|nr:type II CAAX endopeptidase family protein [Virgibacillus sp. 7505]PAE14721.1 CPBP family intramembrane metalloprotease [Virgibacillus sp. 7505]